MANPQTENGYVRIATELLDALCMIHLPGRAWQVFNSILRKTYGYNKKEDWITVSQIEAMTGATTRDVRRALAYLKDAGMIRRDEKGVTSIVKDFEHWELSTAGGGVAKLPLAKLAGGSGKIARLGVAKLPPTIDTLTKDNLQKTGGVVDKSGTKGKKKIPYIEGDRAFQDPTSKNWRVQIHTGEWVDYVGSAKPVWR